MMLVATIGVLCVFAVVIAIQGYLLYRASVRLLQFDDVFQGIAPILSGYADDLVGMSSANIDGILVDHPEVAAFHRRNIAAQREIASLIESVIALTPRRPSKPALPRPDTE